MADPRAKLSDVAREAGVSLATVDRVLHQRPGASTRSLSRVHEALRRLDDVAQPDAVPGPARLVCCLLPAGDNAFVLQLRAELTALVPWMADQGARLEIRTTDAFTPTTAAAAVRRLRGQYDAVVLMLQDHPLVRDAVERMRADGTCVATLVSDIPTHRPSLFVGIDNRAAGRTAATLLSRFTGAQAGRIGIVLGSRSLVDHGDRLRGFEQAMAAECQQLTLLAPLEGHDRRERVRAQIEALLQREPGLIGLYSIGAGNAGIHEALHAADARGRVAWVCHELTHETRAALLDGTASAVIGQSAAQEARAACRLVLARLNRLKPAAAEPIRIEIYLKDNLP